jgi:ElaB/YqjD/DUF883 family membrane-anchored ribosome-binding protein
MNASATVNDTLDRASNGARRVGKGLERGAERVRRTAATELSSLIADVEDLLKKVAHVADVDVAQLRSSVQGKIDSARDTLASGGKRISETARQAAGATDHYVRRSPWQAVGVAALAGAAVGYLFSRR